MTPGQSQCKFLSMPVFVVPVPVPPRPGAGGNAWHPANRKVKVSVYVKELGLTPLARERLLALVGRRYKPNRDELTIVSERWAPPPTPSLAFPPCRI